jgi:hypothetical protein
MSEGSDVFVDTSAYASFKSIAHVAFPAIILNGAFTPMIIYVCNCLFNISLTVLCHNYSCCTPDWGGSNSPLRVFCEYSCVGSVWSVYSSYRFLY